MIGHDDIHISHVDLLVREEAILPENTLFQVRSVDATSSCWLGSRYTQDSILLLLHSTLVASDVGTSQPARHADCDAAGGQGDSSCGDDLMICDLEQDLNNGEKGLIM